MKSKSELLHTFIIAAAIIISAFTIGKSISNGLDSIAQTTEYGFTIISNQLDTTIRNLPYKN
ncbi:hypothetical protein K6V78_02325 [Streptococcus gallolyticus]|uniref:hypothetical protein n=1 Tax=Streptococcus hepaticus TaxID=3349163 RepID=UPI001C989C1C|nr:hypothetical protein [Streptococcus gallolyticus]MBY5040475.1 hypothetical protein [Streptococcus gallolyticus]